MRQSTWYRGVAIFSALLLCTESLVAASRYERALRNCDAVYVGQVISMRNRELPSRYDDEPARFTDVEMLIDTVLFVSDPSLPELPGQSAVFQQLGWVGPDEAISLYALRFRTRQRYLVFVPKPRADNGVRTPILAFPVQATLTGEHYVTDFGGNVISGFTQEQVSVSDYRLREGILEPIVSAASLESINYESVVSGIGGLMRERAQVE